MSIDFKRILLDKSNICEACSVADFNNDGNLEIICGEYMYFGKDFSSKRKICSIKQEHGYLHDFSDYPLDVNGDGFLDIVTGSWWSGGLFWRENPKNDTDEWVTHKITDTSNVETIRFFDIDNCGTVEVFPNNPEEPQAYYKLIKDAQGKPTAKFEKYLIGGTRNAGHGLGFGDISGNGKIDIILSGGWLEQPDDVYAENWTFHEDFSIPSASIPIICYDLNNDGLNDLIVGAGHNFGLWWLEQKIENGVRKFIKHEIDMENSQYHDMQLLDVDNDGELELITGARHFAHNGKDPGELNPIGVYVFKYDKTNNIFIKHILNFGPAETTSGTGIYFWPVDLNGNGKIDLVMPGKEGLYLFMNECK